LDGLEATELSLSKVLEDNEVFRLDSEYFKKEYLRNEAVIKSKAWVYLENVRSSIKSFGAYSLTNEVTYLDEGIPFLRAQNIKDGVVDFSDSLYIDEKANKLLWKSEVKPKMVLLTMSGSVGNAAVALEDWTYPVNSNQDIAKITTLPQLNPYYLCVALCCRQGQLQMQRLPVGSVQQHTFIWQLEKLLIPICSEPFQQEIEKIYKASQQRLRQSQSLYSEAESILLEELGLKDWQPPGETIAVKAFSESVGSKGRLDAEYYHPNKQSILDCLANIPGRTIGEHFTSVNETLNPVQIKSDELIQNYDLDDALQFFINEKESVSALELGSTKVRFKKNDVIVSRLRSYLKEIALVDTPETANCVGSSEFIVLRPQSEEVNPELLLVYLRSLPVQVILKWCQAGSNHPRFMEEDLLSIKLPEKLIRAQQQIKQTIRTAIEARRDSKRLLELTKRGVEIAIEQDETAALAWMNEQTRQMDLS
jgi:type I restriction enzyme M protein